MADRDSLASRTLPFIKLSGGEGTPPNRPPSPLPSDLSAQERAQVRFEVKGNIVITGGAGNLGLSAARALLEHGASGCSLWDLESTIRSSQPEILKLAQTFPKARVFAIAVDVTDAEAINEAIESVVKIGGPIRHLFCFAGIVGCHHALEMTEAQWKKILDVNTTGSFLCAQAIGKHIVGRKSNGSDAVTAEGEFTGNLIPSGGTITLIGSVSAHAVNFPQAQAAYNVSKSAVVALKSSLAAEWAVHGIRVNSISPGYMDTILNSGEGNIVEARKMWMSRNPMGRMGAVGELDGMCVLLASRAGSYINGADMVIDGGMSVF